LNFEIATNHVTRNTVGLRKKKCNGLSKEEVKLCEKDVPTSAERRSKYSEKYSKNTG